MSSRADSKPEPLRDMRKARLAIMPGDRERGTCQHDGGKGLKQRCLQQLRDIDWRRL